MAAQRSRKRIILGVRYGLSLLALVGALASFLPLIDTNLWWVRFLAFPRVQILCALVVVLTLLIALPGRFRPLSLFATAVAAAGIAAQCAVLVPYSPAVAVQALAVERCAPKDRLRIVAVNVQMTNEHADRLFSILARVSPDLILFQEIDPWWDQRLAALRNAYPYSKEHVTQNYFGIHLLSKYPLVGPKVHFLTGSRDPSIFTGVRLPSGQLIRFYGIHPRPPTIGQSSVERDGQILAAALAVAGDEKPSVVVGDLNAAPWSEVVRQAARIASLLDPRIGRGWAPTYHTQALVMTWPLDQILFGDRFVLTDFEVLPFFGSDHRPVLGDLCYAPAAANRQRAPQPDPDDFEQARLAIRKAQNAAVPSPEPTVGRQMPYDAETSPAPNLGGSR